MKLGFVSAILPDLPFEDVIQFASETGYSCVEVEDRAYEASLETRKAALRQSVRFLRQYMP